MYIYEGNGPAASVASQMRRCNTRRLLGYAIRDDLQHSNLPVHSFFNEEPLEEAAAQRSFALLNLLANPDDRVALRWWLCSGSQTGLADQYLKLRIHCQKNGWSPKEALDAILNGRMSIQGIGKLSSKYLELRNAVSELQDLPLEDVIGFVLPEGEDELGELRDIALRAAVDADSVKDLFSTMQAHIT